MTTFKLTLVRLKFFLSIKNSNYFLFLVEDAKTFLSAEGRIEIPDKDLTFNEKKYDAFLLYVEQDVDFARELKNRVENEMGFKLFIKDRDLEPGAPIEMSEILDVIVKRVNRLIVVVSNAFLTSPMEKYFTDFAQSLGIFEQRKIIVPCVREFCQIPSSMRFMFSLKFYQTTGFIDWWDKLRITLEEDRAIPSTSR